jgi:NAD-dependent deacetylase
MRIYRDDARISETVERGDVPYCEFCGGVLKPNVVFFGELLPRKVMLEVEREIAECDLIIVAGTSLEVQPACLWPDDAVHHGARAIVVNLQPTYLDDRADVAIRADVAAVLPEIVEALPQ